MTNAIIQTQRDLINEARRNGTLKLAIFEKLSLDGGMSTRQDILAYVCDVVDLGPVDELMKHGTNGKARTHVASALDYCIYDINSGKHGEKFINAVNLDDGIWSLSEEFVVDFSEMSLNDFVPKRSEKELRKHLKSECVEIYSKLSSVAKKMFKSNGGNMQQIIDTCVCRNISPYAVIMKMVG